MIIYYNHYKRLKGFILVISHPQGDGEGNEMIRKKDEV